MILTPKRPTWKRWLRISTLQYSLLRGLEYESIDGLVLCGKTLDIGGGQVNSYYHLFQIEGKIESVNISPQIKPTVISDFNNPLPIASNVYDNIISLNTFEHIKNDTLAISEAIRVLKPGGQFHFMIPFLYRVHGTPFDYHRHTATWWLEFLSSLENAPREIIIDPLVWSPGASAFSLVEFHRLRRLRKKPALLWAVLRHLSQPGLERLPDGPVSQFYAEHALGYYVFGRK